MRRQNFYDSYFINGPTGQRVWRGRRVVVHEWEQGLLFRHGQVVKTLAAGAHRFFGAGYALRRVDLRPWILQVPTQEVPTADGVTVKVTVVGRVRIVDAVTFVTATQDAHTELYFAAQIAVREVLANTTVEQLLASRGELGAQLLAGVRGVDVLGVALDALEVRDIVLPAELKRAQGEVLVARAQGLAALERARSETAALRGLANAARLAADNPALLQLRLVQELGATTGHTVVIGSPSLGA